MLKAIILTIIYKNNNNNNNNNNSNNNNIITIITLIFSSQSSNPGWHDLVFDAGMTVLHPDIPLLHAVWGFQGLGVEELEFVLLDVLSSHIRNTYPNRKGNACRSHTLCYLVHGTFWGIVRGRGSITKLAGMVLPLIQRVACHSWWTIPGNLVQGRL